MEYTRKEVETLKKEANPETLLTYVEELERRLLKMYELCNTFLMQTCGEGLSIPTPLENVLYKKEESNEPF